MSESSDKKSADVISISGAGHRSPQRAVTGEPAAAEKPVAAGPSTEVFAVFGAEPEIQAYAMAK